MTQASNFKCCCHLEAALQSGSAAGAHVCPHGCASTRSEWVSSFNTTTIWKAKNVGAGLFSTQTKFAPTVVFSLTVKLRGVSDECDG